MKSKRDYRMTARADAAIRTGERILLAMEQELFRHRYEEITLAAVAKRAGVTLQTVLRRFGSKEALLAAGAEFGRKRVGAERGRAPAGDVPGAIANLFDHYEKDGRMALRMLEAEYLPAMAPVTRAGRALHHRWVERIFAGQLAKLPPKARNSRRCQLIALTDVYVWKLLRHDLRLDRREAERALLQMVEAVVGGKK